MGVASAGAARVQPPTGARRSPDEFLLGAHPAMQEARRALERFATGILPVLILGETGTGKELAARCIHALSPRRDERFTVLHCGALPESLLESELFGHEKGAFTGAVASRVGRFGHADGGTVFLDEIGDLPLPAQVKLLRVLEHGEIFRLGANDPDFIDVRVVAATNADLPRLLREGRFREDLFHRLLGGCVVLPPLRDHLCDLERLAAHFLGLYARATNAPVRALQGEALDVLRAHPWPGNVRELRNVLWRAAECSDAPALGGADLRSALAVPGARLPVPPPTDGEACRLRSALEAHRWNVTRAAQALGVSRSWLHRLMRRHGLGG
jgi:DNA-binding NtrC family response regulator